MRIGFICTGNSARSQIAEGYAKYFAKLFGKNVEVYSAGSNPVGYVHPLAIKVMEEDGIDISKQSSKPLESIPYLEMDVIITLCGDAAENCPYIPGARTEHWNLTDPAKASGSEDEKMTFFRMVRDEIKVRVKKLLEQV